MEVRKKTVTTEVLEYVANDGISFETEEGCLEWERFLENQSANLLKIPKVEGTEDMMPCDGCEHMEYNSYLWIIPQSQDDIDLLNAYYRHYKYCDDDVFCSAYIGIPICIETAGDSIWVTRAEDSAKYAKVLLEKLGYTVTLTPPKR